MAEDWKKYKAVSHFDNDAVIYAVQVGGHSERMYLIRDWICSQGGKADYNELGLVVTIRSRLLKNTPLYITIACQDGDYLGFRDGLLCLWPAAEFGKYFAPVPTPPASNEETGDDC